MNFSFHHHSETILIADESDEIAAVWCLLQGPVDISISKRHELFVKGHTYVAVQECIAYVCIFSLEVYSTGCDFSRARGSKVE